MRTEAMRLTESSGAAGGTAPEQNPAAEGPALDEPPKEVPSGSGQNPAAERSALRRTQRFSRDGFRAGVQ